MNDDHSTKSQWLNIATLRANWSWFAATAGLAVLTSLTAFNLIESKTAFAAALGACLAACAWHLAGRIQPAKDTKRNTLRDAAPSSEIESWRRMIHVLPEAVVLFDATESAIIENPAARQLLGKSMLGRSLDSLSRDPELLAAIERVLSSGMGSTINFSLRRSTERQLEATAGLLQSEANGARFVLLTIRDASQQLRLLEMRSDFIANASHELRTPLASVRGFIETLQGPARKDIAAHDRFLSIMATQAERMTRLIDDLLLLSRVEERAFLPPKNRVDVRQIIEEVIESLTPLADERNVTIAYEASSDSHELPGDRDELYQVFQNLIENALKYGKDGGWIKINSALIGGRENGRNRSHRSEILEITVADNGDGISPEHLPRLTERFYRVNADHSRKVGGTGLGLAIVKHVLTRHCGGLSFASEVGKGTTARVELPTKQYLQ